MSTTVVQQPVTVNSYNPSVTRKTSLREWFAKHIVAINITSLAIVLLMCATYIVQVNSTIAKGYVLRDLETQIHHLALENEQLEIAQRESQSLDHVSHAVKMLGLVENDEVTYVNDSAPSYALAE